MLWLRDGLFLGDGFCAFASREPAQLLLLLIGADEAGGDDQLGRVLDRQIERDDLARRHEHDEACRRVGAVRHEDGDERMAGADLVVDLDRGIAGEEDEAIKSRASETRSAQRA